MVAYTSEFCLPYLEGSDNLCVNTGTVCEPSTVWCDLATLLDGQLTVFDEIRARAVDSFPYAQVAITSLPHLYQLGDTTGSETLLPWDSVIGDSDSMVNLGVDPYTITLRRSGIWNISAEVVSYTSVSLSNISTRLVSSASPLNSFSAQFASIRRVWVEPVVYLGSVIGSIIGLSNVMDFYARADVSNGPIPLQLAYQLGSGTPFNLGTINFAQFSARWVADLP